MKRGRGNKFPVDQALRALETFIMRNRDGEFMYTLPQVARLFDINPKTMRILVRNYVEWSMNKFRAEHEQKAPARTRHTRSGGFNSDPRPTTEK